MRQPHRLRVGFNAGLLSPGHDYRAAGIHRYIVALLEGLGGRRDVAVTAFTLQGGGGSVLPAGVGERAATPLGRGRAGRVLWEQTALPRLMRGANVELYHGAAYAMPLATRIPAVVTVHDLSFFRHPETLPRAQALYLRAATRVSARRAAALIAVSAFTASELQAVLRVPRDRVHVVPNGHDERLEPQPRPAVEAFRARRQLPEAFVLAVGTLQPRKNLGVLLSAYAVAREAGLALPPLVVAGGRGWGESDIEAAARRLGLADVVSWLGFVPSEDLALLYSAATMLALPSRYEGFGLPVLEAMACGTPVVAADASSLPEVAGDAALLVGPDDAEGWARALHRLASDRELAATLSTAGLRRVSTATWQRTADGTVAVYRRVLAADGPPVGADRG